MFIQPQLNKARYLRLADDVKEYVLLNTMETNTNELFMGGNVG